MFGGISPLCDGLGLVTNPTRKIILIILFPLYQNVSLVPKNRRYIEIARGQLAEIYQMQHNKCMVPVKINKKEVTGVTAQYLPEGTYVHTLYVKGGAGRCQLHLFLDVLWGGCGWTCPYNRHSPALKYTDGSRCHCTSAMTSA